jgi:alkylation response protein AidB-like acyl-CoA dehydrogenase
MKIPPFITILILSNAAISFKGEVVRPYTAKLDRKVQEDREFLPHEFIEEANRWGLYTLWIPRIFGGKGEGEVLKVNS